MNRFLSSLSLALPIASLSLCAGLLLSGCGGAKEDDKMLELRGLVSYDENFSLPANARLEVDLLDMTNVGGTPPVLGRVVIENAGQPPIGFEITFNSANFENGHIYAVDASIFDGPLLLFTTVKPQGADLEKLDGLLQVVVQRPE